MQARGTRSSGGRKAVRRTIGTVATVAVLTTLAPAYAAPQSDRAQEPRSERKAAPDLDVRKAQGGKAAVGPSSASRAAAAREGLEVRWDPTAGLVRSASRAGGYLTGPSSADPGAIVVDYLRSHADLFGLSAAEAGTFVVTGSYQTDHNNVTQVYVGQSDHGRRVYGSVLAAVVAGDGRLVSINGQYQPDLTATGDATVTGEQSVDKAAKAAGASASRPATPAAGDTAGKRRLQNTYAKGLTAPSDVTAELVSFPNGKGKGSRLAWRTVVEVDPDSWFESVVDAKSGDVLYRHNLYSASEAHGTVWTSQNPTAAGDRVQVPFGGWVAARATEGNNTTTYEDRDGNNSSDYQTQTPASGDPNYQHFDYAFANAWATNADGTAASLNTDRDAVLTQLFYWVNFSHDYLYGLGFNEVAGNFQTDNFGRGGTGNDRVLAEAFDQFNTGKKCNANFGTNGDGTEARLQVFVGDNSQTLCPYRLSEVEGDTVVHEYGHGVSRRLVGNGSLGSGVQTGALGEGWGDFLAGSVFNDPVLFEYDSGRASTGLRRVRYDTSGWTYANLCNGGCEVHNDGEIWATALWDLREALVAKYQYDPGKARVERLVIDGMKATGSSPDFLDARDGILSADQSTNGGSDRCLIWRVFANVAMGQSATSASDQTTIATATDVPANCRPTAEAGGPYTTPEGTDVTVSASGSTPGSDPSTGALSYAWDLDNDSQYDDATGVTASFTTVGRDGSATVGLQVTNGAGLTATDAATVVVTNVAPSIVASTPAPTPEGSAVTITATVSDPGWLDPLSATIDWGDGGGPSALAGIVENSRPDATLTLSASHRYGDNGSYTVTLCGSDDDSTTCVTRTAVVTNVAPTVAGDAGQVTAIVEGGAVTVAATFSDPGWLDTYTATIDWGTGDIDAVTPMVTVQGGPGTPDSGTVAGNHVYGDNGTFTVTVSVTDDDGGTGTATFGLTVSNVNPIVTIDESGTALVNGTPTVFAHVGTPVPFQARTTDPGSDDLVLAWDWDDGGPAPDVSTTSLVNPPTPDPFPSPSVQPRDVTDSRSHAFGVACRYDVGFRATDDDGGTAADALTVIITGNATRNRSAGYWSNQYRVAGPRNANDFSDAQLLCYLDIVQWYSRVFSEVRGASTLAAAFDVLKTNGTSDPRQLLELQLLGAWLNFANGTVDPSTLIDTDGNKVPDTPFLTVVAAAETARLQPGTSSATLLRWKDVLERFNLRDGG